MVNVLRFRGNADLSGLVDAPPEESAGDSELPLAAGK
jgi:hypothetical protein